MAQDESMIWQCRDRRIFLGQRTLVMGILNVTPDSFSDGGHYLAHDQALRHALRMIEEGADIIDVGGESTRPGASEVSAEEEASRVVPVIAALAAQTSTLLSVDTTKASVAGAAIEAGAHIVNDVSACTQDADMEHTLVASDVGVVLMHMQGTPRTMQQDPVYDDVVKEVGEYLRTRVDALVARGVARERLAVDPGIGFGKSVEHNVRLLAHVPTLAKLGRPLLVGLSRKSFLGKITGCEVDQRLAASLAGAAYVLDRGAHIIRVHDVKESCDLARIIDTLRAEEVGEWRF